MGVYISMYGERGAYIPETIKETFEKNLEKVFQAGGMMEKEYSSLFGKDIVTIRKATMHDWGMEFTYNYFEDDSWENAGYSKKNCCVWSNKVGGRQFCDAVAAAYTLQELYTEGATALEIEEFVTEEEYTGWLNYLFDENFCLKNNDPWSLYEMMARGANEDDEMKYLIDRCRWNEYPHNDVGWLGYMEVYAVRYGTEDFLNRYRIKKLERPDNGMLSIAQALLSIKKFVCNFHKSQETPEENQERHLVSILKKFYEGKNIKEMEAEGIPIGDNEKGLLLFTLVCNMPAYVVKVIAEEYNIDFWKLWKMFGDTPRRIHLDKKSEYIPKPIRTEDFFRCDPNDMIPYWERGGRVVLSREIWDQLGEYKKLFDSYLNSDLKIEPSVKWVIGLVSYVYGEYFRVYVFSDFLEETLENLSDRRYLVLWKIYEDMAYDPEMIKMNHVIYVLKEELDSTKGIFGMNLPDNRRLKSRWEFIPRKERLNPARKKLRDYMAFVGNKDLRKDVLGF